MDKERILVKIGEMNQFIRELEAIAPESLPGEEEYIFEKLHKNGIVSAEMILKKFQKEVLEYLKKVR